MKDFLEWWLQIFPRGTLGEGMGTLRLRPFQKVKNSHASCTWHHRK